MSAGLEVTNITHSSTSLQCIFNSLLPAIAARRSHFSSPKVNTTLRELWLSWNSFGRAGAESLGQALKQNSVLELLDLSSNQLDDRAVTLLCQGLATNDTLRVLKVSGQKG